MKRIVREPQGESEWRENYELRWRVLRAPWRQPRGSEQDEHEADALHRVCLELDEAAGLSRLVGTARAHRVDAQTAQIRYMAVVDDRRGTGVGGLLLRALEDALRAAGVTEVVLNARESALAFYERRGYRVVGEAPTLYGEIRHARMSKDI